MTTNPFGGSMTDLETRVARLEQTAVRTHTQPVNVYADPDTGDTVVEHTLDWSAANNLWEPYSQIGPIATDPTLPDGQLSTEYPLPEASMIGSMCVLSGLIRRKAGAPNLVAGTRYNQPLFGLPPDWRPVSNIILPCLMGNASPLTANTVSTAWIEIRANMDLVSPPVSGRAYYVAGSSACTAGSGWIALSGIFPCQVLPTVAPLVVDSWADVSDFLTWDQVDDDVTWDSYPDSV